ncbi:putative diacylglycerol O-acyltransferase tgs1 [Marasmius tenuissimus]|uniref:Trimethylguanosine synthase n=1 Tax=Marasmius tenuissimus TaxID=585030 RepID=A0ABR2ZZ64_9AGAR|nr:putative diacylglycerol O-acyltransferase tgs1 [Marasmius tenuissimus]
MGKKRSAFSGLGRFVQTIQQAPNPSKNDEASQPQDRPAKKRKISDAEQSTSTSSWVKKYEMTGLIPHYTDPDQVPEALKKYFHQRTRYFSLYSTPPGCLLDEEGWYSVTPERIADQIAERCRCDTIVDAFCGVGGNAIAFAKTCQRVIALDTSPTRLALARHNAQIYGVSQHIEFILGDYISFAKSYTPSSGSKRKIDVVFLSPPWGGPSYISDAVTTTEETDADTDNHPVYSLASIQPIHGAELFNLTRRITPNIAYYLPRNTDIGEVGALVDAGAVEGDVKEYVEVEEEWMGNKLKALTCYFGGLVDGQGDLFG